MADSQDFKSLVQAAIDNWSLIYQGLSNGRHYDSDFLETYGDQIKALVQYHNSMVKFISKYLPVNVKPDIRYKATNDTIVSNIDEACWYLIDIEVSYYVYSISGNAPVFNKTSTTFSNLTLSLPNPNSPELITNQVPIDNGDFPVEIRVNIDKPFGVIGDGPELCLIDGLNSEVITYDMLNNTIEPDSLIKLTIPGSLVIGYKHGNYHKLHWVNITKQIIWLRPNGLFNVSPTEVVVVSTEPNPTVEATIVLNNANTVVRALTITPNLTRTGSNLESTSADYITVVSPDGNIQQLSPDTSSFIVNQFGQYQFYINDLSSYKKLVNVILQALDQYFLSTGFYTGNTRYSEISEFSHLGTNGVVTGNSLPVGSILEAVFTEAINNMEQVAKVIVLKALTYSHCMLPWLHSDEPYTDTKTAIINELMTIFMDMNLAQKPSLINGNSVTLRLYDDSDNEILEVDYLISAGVGTNPFNVESGQYGASRIPLNILLINTIINNYYNNYSYGYLTVTPKDPDDNIISPENINGDPEDSQMGISMNGFTSSVGVIADSQIYYNNPENVTISDLSDVYPELVETPVGGSSNLSQLRITLSIWGKVSLINRDSYYDIFDQLSVDFLDFGYDIISHLQDSKLVFGTSNGYTTGTVLNYNYRWTETFNQYFNSGDLTLFEPFYFMEQFFLQNSGQSGESSRSPGIDKLFVTMTGFYDIYHCVREIESFNPNNMFAKVGGQSMRGVNISTVDKMIMRCNGILHFSPTVINPDLIYEGDSWYMPINEFPRNLLQAIMEVNRPHDDNNWEGAPWFYKIRDNAGQPYDYKNPKGFDYLERPFGSTSPRRLTQFIFPFPGVYELTSQIIDNSLRYTEYCVPIYVLVSPTSDHTGLNALKIDIINGYNTNTANSYNYLYNQLLKPELNPLHMGNSDAEFEANGIIVIRPKGYTLSKRFTKTFNIQDRF